MGLRRKRKEKKNEFLDLLSKIIGRIQEEEI